MYAYRKEHIKYISISNHLEAVQRDISGILFHILDS